MTYHWMPSLHSTMHCNFYKPTAKQWHTTLYKLKAYPWKDILYMVCLPIEYLLISASSLPFGFKSNKAVNWKRRWWCMIIYYFIRFNQMYADTQMSGIANSQILNSFEIIVFWQAIIWQRQSYITLSPILYFTFFLFNHFLAYIFDNIA